MSLEAFAVVYFGMGLFFLFLFTFLKGFFDAKLELVDILGSIFWPLASLYFLGALAKYWVVKRKE